MDIDTLMEMFDPFGVAPGMWHSDVISGVHEMRASEPDDLDMTDEEIAVALDGYVDPATDPDEVDKLP